LHETEQTVNINYMDQLEIHQKIDTLLLEGTEASVDRNLVSSLVSINHDAYIYFFSRADERWLDWLWGNGFLSILETNDIVREGYRTPEVDYLAKVATKRPTKVVDIMLAIKITDANFNPDTVSGFLRIVSKLPANEIGRIVSKIRDEQWVQKMGKLNDWGFDYEAMFKRLAEVRDFESVLILAQVVLAVKPEYDTRASGYISDNPFFFNELIYTKVFDYLIKIDDENQEKALSLAIDTMAKVTNLGKKNDKDSDFEIIDSFALYDVDFFELDLTDRNTLSHRDDVKNLAYTIKYFSQKIIGDKCGSISPEIYDKYFASLPNSQSMWRLRLYVLSLCPHVFSQYLKQALFRIFEAKRYTDFIMGAEYLTVLKRCFSTLSYADKRAYINGVIEYFHNKDKNKTHEKEDWHLKYGSRILSVIPPSEITPAELQLANDSGFTIFPEYKPKPSIGPVHTAWGITPRGPISQEEFDTKTLAEVASKLRVEWNPEELIKNHTSDDFHAPLNGEGAGAMLRADISRRPTDYIENASLFFERDVLDSHYTYCFLQGMQGVLKNKVVNVNAIDWNKFFDFCLMIKKSGEIKPFDTEIREREKFDSWLAGWSGVHSAMADILQDFLNEECLNDESFNKYRPALFALVSYLLTFRDPVPDNERIESASIKTKSKNNNDSVVGDPFTMAINTARGRAFQAFVFFVIRDIKNFPKEDKIKITLDSKKVYELTLKNEDTRALMFMFGYYLPTFYFRDREWIDRLLPQIFPIESDKKNLYTAAWEGYVTTGVYEELFFNPKMQSLYSRGLQLKETDYPKQNHFKDPDEGIAIHIALAFIHFSDFGFESVLYKNFWISDNKKEHEKFISFIGRHAITRGAVLEWLKYNKIDIEKIKAFWNWALDNCTPDALAGFGTWLSEGDTPFDLKWLAERLNKTLAKTSGYLEWTYGLTQMLPRLAKESPEETLALLRSYLLEEVAKHQPIRTWIHIDREITDALIEIYKNANLKINVKSLIDDLLPYRDGLFWNLKSILNTDQII
jgi:hypothetical protein